VRAEYGDKIAKARAERSATTAEVGEGAADVAKLRNAYDNLAVRNTLYRIDAPQDGYVVQALRAGVGEQVKEGEAVVTIMPARPAPGGGRVREGDGRAPAEHGAQGAAAVRRLARRCSSRGGRACRWAPSAGQVAVIDRVSQPDGTYRVLVTEDPTDDPWPAQLRQGSGVLGWAMLDEVRPRLRALAPTQRLPAVDQAAGRRGDGRAKATASK
jgi:hypothetical protein